MLTPWVLTLDALYRLKVKDAPEPFRENYDIFMKKIMLFAQYRMHDAFEVVSAMVTDGGLRAAGLLSHMLSEENADSVGHIFTHLMRVIPDEADVDIFARSLFAINTKGPLILYQLSRGVTFFYMYRDGETEDITGYCRHGGHALEALFKLHVVASIPWPEEMDNFYQFLRWFLFFQPPDEKNQKPPHGLKTIYKVLKKTTPMSLGLKLSNIK